MFEYFIDSINSVEVNGLNSVVKLLISLLLGCSVGLERKRKGQIAGLRTFALISMGATLAMILSIYVPQEYLGLKNGDPGRIAAQVITGIGFLGAGAIIQGKGSVRGLTTAAGIWATAGVGMAAGAGLYVVAVGATILIIAVQCICHINCKLFSTKKFYRVRIAFKNVGDESNKVKELFETEHFNSLSIARDGDQTVYHAVLKTDKEYSSQTLNEIMENNPFIISVERCDDE